MATTFLGFYSSLSSYSEDNGLTGFLATTFLGAGTSTFTCLVGFLATTGVSSSSDDSGWTCFLTTFFSSTCCFLDVLAATIGTELSDSSSESLDIIRNYLNNLGFSDFGFGHDC